MAKFCIIYFSATGNGKHLALKSKQLIKENFNEEVDLINVDDNENKDLSNYEYLFFTYPIYAFNAPKNFMKYIKKLNISKNHKCYIFKQSGEPHYLNDASSSDLKRIIKRRGATLFGEYHYLYPYNIHFRYSDDLIRAIFTYNLMLSKIFIDDFKNNRKRTIKSNVFKDFISRVLKIQRFGGTVNSFLYKVDNDKCVKCYKCVKECPVDNIYVKNGKIRFHHKCLMCMKCSFNCPTDAFHIGFLESWKVNGAYHLNNYNIDQIDEEVLYNIGGDNWFFELFIKQFKKFKEIYDQIYKDM